MHIKSLVLASTALASFVSATVGDAPAQVNPLAPRQSADPEEAYLSSVCTPPNVANAPCQVINDIQAACLPNGTAPIAYIAHQECMCGGGFFSNWFGCLNCLYVHGGRSQAQSIAFSQILTSASNDLCTGTPTTDFAAIFASLTNAAPSVASTAATVTSDHYPSQTAVSLYYTASGPQGPGSITGSAAQATTKTPSSGSASAGGTQGTTGASGATTTQASAGTGSGTNTGTASAASKTSSSGAGPTNIYGGLLGIAVGGALIVAM